MIEFKMMWDDEDLDHILEVLELARNKGLNYPILRRLEKRIYTLKRITKYQHRLKIQPVTSRRKRPTFLPFE